VRLVVVPTRNGADGEQGAKERGGGTGVERKEGKRKGRVRLRKPIMIIEWAHRHDAARRPELEKRKRRSVRGRTGPRKVVPRCCDGRGEGRGEK